MFKLFGSTIVMIVAVFQAMAQTNIPLNGAKAPSDGIWFKYDNRHLKDDMLSQTNGIIWYGDNKGVSYTVASPDIPIKATHLDFVQTFHPDEPLYDWMAASGLAHRKNQLPPDLPVVAIYQITYEDSSTVNIPVRYGESIQNWFRVHTVGPMLWAEPNEVHEFDDNAGTKAAVYKMQWPNPPRRYHLCERRVSCA